MPFLDFTDRTAWGRTGSGWKRGDSEDNASVSGSHVCRLIFKSFSSVVPKPFHIQDPQNHTKRTTFDQILSRGSFWYLDLRHVIQDNERSGQNVYEADGGCLRIKTTTPMMPFASIVLTSNSRCDVLCVFETSKKCSGWRAEGREIEMLREDFGKRPYEVKSEEEEEEEDMKIINRERDGGTDGVWMSLQLSVNEPRPAVSLRDHHSHSTLFPLAASWPSADDVTDTWRHFLARARLNRGSFSRLALGSFRTQTNCGDEIIFCSVTEISWKKTKQPKPLYGAYLQTVECWMNRFLQLPSRCILTQPCNHQ